jgi:hypothetical protein
MILSEKILMIEPRGFSFNKQTSEDNFFQSSAAIKAPGEAAMREFQELKNKLVGADIMVTVISSIDGINTPDAVFPNNWFSTTPNGQMILYPMMAPNRRLERRKEIIEKVRKDYPELIDLTRMEERESYLEGTGSLVLDHNERIAYASLSKRTSKEALAEWEKAMGYEVITFTSYDNNNEIIYHTNVVLTLGDGFAIVCAEAIRDQKEREMVIKKLSEKKEIILITKTQLHSYCGNCIELKGRNFSSCRHRHTRLFQRNKKV